MLWNGTLLKNCLRRGKVECGMMVTGWFIWAEKFEGFPMINVLDMQKYIVKKSYNKLED